MIEEYIKKSGKWILSLGLGGLISVSLVNYINRVVILLFNNLANNVSNQDNNNFMILSIILLVSIIFLIIAPFLMNWTKTSIVKVLAIIFIVFSNVTGIISVIARGEMFHAYIIIMWLSISYIIRLIIELLEYLYHWLIADNENTEKMVIKLTFLWTILAFIIGKVW